MLSNVKINLVGYKHSREISNNAKNLKDRNEKVKGGTKKALPIFLHKKFKEIIIGRKVFQRVIEND